MADTFREGLVLLPDQRGTVPLDGGLGPVRAVQPALFAADAASAMAGEPTSSTDVAAVRDRLAQRLAQGEEAAWRGMLAAALLLDMWETDCRLETVALHAADSPLCEAVLRSMKREDMHLVRLRRGDREAVIGLADERYVLIPAADLADLCDLLPEELGWYNRAGKVFEDPCALLSETDRTRLMARLSALSGRDAAIDRFDQALAEAAGAAIRAADEGDEHNAWAQRVRVVAALTDTERFDALTTAQLRRSASGDNALLHALGVRDPELPATVTTVWLWQGIPFARSAPSLGLEGLHTAAEGDILAELAEEERLLAAHSAAYRQALPERLAVWRETWGAGLAAPLAARLDALRQEAASAAIALPEMLELTWPYRAGSPAILRILTEYLGEASLPGLLQPFAERLAILPEGQLGEPTLDAACHVSLTGRTRLVFPPLSEALGAFLAKAGVTPETLRLRELALGRVRVSLMMHGSGTVLLHRVYEPDEQLQLNSLPRIGLWPAIRPADSRWRYWLLSVTGAAEIGYLRGESWQRVTVAAADGERILSTDTWPACISLRLDGQEIGALPDTTPPVSLPRAGLAHAGLEVGNSGLGMALRLAGALAPFALPPLWKPVLTDGHAQSENLPTGELQGILPMYALVRPDAEEAEPFVSGRMTLGAIGLDAEPEAGLLLRQDAAGERARVLCLREGLLLLSLCGLLRGAERIIWRLAWPATLSATEQSALLREVRDASAWVNRQTGYPIGRDEAGDSLRAALATSMWLRSLEPATAFAMLEVGSSTTVLSVCLPGGERPTFEKRLDTGIAAMLTPVLRLRPDWVAELTGVGGVTVSALERWLTAPADEKQAASQIWYHLDQLLGPQLAETSALMNARQEAMAMTGMQALLLLGYAERLTLLGMGLEQLYRTPVLGDRLPVAMRLYLTGRGVLPLTHMEAHTRDQLKRFLRLAMNQRHPVRAIQWTPSPACRMEAALTAAAADMIAEGTPDTSRVGGMSLGQVLVNFMLLFRAALPEACDVLFAPLYAPDGSLTRDAWEGLVALAQDYDGDPAEDFLTCMAIVLTDTAQAMKHSS